MDFTLRPIHDSELAEFWRVLEHVFFFDPQEEDWELIRALFEFDRSLAVFDGADIVGTAGAVSFQLTVPGGAAIPCAGVTDVGVLPTHIRRGVATSLMRQQLQDVAARGESVATLWASESVIYGRFGYGNAVPMSNVTIGHRPRMFREPTDVPGRLRMVQKEEASKILPAIHDSRRSLVPGMLDRSAQHWAWTFADRPDSRNGATANRFVVYEVDGHATGYVRYRVKDDWKEQNPAGQLIVPELMAADLDGYRALWEYLFNVDLVTSTKAYTRPMREPLDWLLADPRQIRRSSYDGMWLRIVDVAAALEARSYLVDDAIVLRVVDEFLERDGTFRLESSGGSAACVPTADAPDVTLSIQSLASLYFGWFKASELAAASALGADATAARRLDALFAWDQVPWAPVHY